MQIKYNETSLDSKPLFKLYEPYNGIYSEDIPLVSPNEKKVGDYKISLRQGLKWYLEDYFHLPVSVESERADEVQSALKEWGNQCFEALFADSQTSEWFLLAQKQGLENLIITIICDEPKILAWPWEALYCDDVGFIAQYCQIERQIPNIDILRQNDVELPNDALNILYIIARPFDETDIDFQTLARPLVDYMVENNIKINIDLLRPPTFDKLCDVLNKNPHHYHMIHFDGHGGMPMQLSEQSVEKNGFLVFERRTETGVGSEAIPADKLGELLNKNFVPYVVLNACQSAAMDEDGTEPFATVAARLLKSGVRGVLAMSYSLWERGAKHFISAFYKQLFKQGNLPKAVLAGRQEMCKNNQRDTFIGTTEFNDWIVPILYRQGDDEYELPLLTEKSANNISCLPDEAQELENENFIGRSAAIQQLERFIQYQLQSGVLIHGLAGEGKTTLSKGFLQWLSTTGGHITNMFWFGFDGIVSVKP